MFLFLLFCYYLLLVLRLLKKLGEFPKTILSFALFLFVVVIMSRAASNFRLEPTFNVLGTLNVGVTVTDCGNNNAEGTEECDGTDLNGQSCIGLGYDGGTLNCDSNCTYDTSSCATTSPTCGNNIKEAGEACDGTDLNGASCSNFGFSNGTLACYGNCTYNLSACFNPNPPTPTPTNIPTSIPGPISTTVPGITISPTPLITDLVTPTPFDGDFSLDSDGDGMPDVWETSYFCMNPLVIDSMSDFDNDGLTNIVEYNNNIDPCDKDSDGDEMPDGWELEFTLEPLYDDANQDPDGDGFLNINEFLNETNPLVFDGGNTSVVPTILPQTGDETIEPISFLLPLVCFCSFLGVAMGGLILFLWKKKGDEEQQVKEVLPS